MNSKYRVNKLLISNLIWDLKLLEKITFKFEVRVLTNEVLYWPRSKEIISFYGVLHLKNWCLSCARHSLTMITGCHCCTVEFHQLKYFHSNAENFNNRRKDGRMWGMISVWDVRDNICNFSSFFFPFQILLKNCECTQILSFSSLYQL